VSTSSGGAWVSVGNTTTHELWKTPPLVAAMLEANADIGSIILRCGDDLLCQLFGLSDAFGPDPIEIAPGPIGEEGELR
jgi:hypothetical protein